MIRTRRSIANVAKIPEAKFGASFEFDQIATGTDGTVFERKTSQYIYLGKARSSGKEASKWRVDGIKRLGDESSLLGILEHQNYDDKRYENIFNTTKDSMSSLFPLAIGNEAKIKMGNGSYSCKVMGKRLVTTPIKEFNTFRINCHTTGLPRIRKEEYYYSTEIAHWVKRKTIISESGNSRTDTYNLRKIN